MDDPRRWASLSVWTVRIVALGIAAALLWWSAQLEREFRVLTANQFTIDWARFWLMQAVYAVAGTAFAVGVRFPFPRSRFAWGRILIAGIVALPVAYSWFAFGVASGPPFLHRTYWFIEVPIAIWSILAGVAIGAGFGARKPAASGTPEAV